MQSRGGRGRPQLSRYIRLLVAVLFYNADSYRETVAVRRQREGWRERVINLSRAVVRLSSQRQRRTRNGRMAGRNPEERCSAPRSPLLQPPRSDVVTDDSTGPALLARARACARVCQARIAT